MSYEVFSNKNYVQEALLTNKKKGVEMKLQMALPTLFPFSWEFKLHTRKQACAQG